MRERLLLAGAALAAFGLSLGSGFHFDDYAIFADRALTGARGWLEVWRPGQTRPLTYLTFWLNYQAGGSDPLAWHAVNLALHVAAVLLLYDCLTRLMPGQAAPLTAPSRSRLGFGAARVSERSRSFRYTALVAAAIFAVHPAQTEAVAYVWARGILLATVFCLLSLRAWLSGRSWQAAAWFAAALLGKEECAAFPLVLILLDRRRWRPAAAMMGLSALAAARVVYAAAVTPGAPIAQKAGISPLDYLLAQGPAIWRYLRLFVLPWGFTVDPGVRVPPLWVGAAAWLAIAALAAVAWRRSVWFVAGLVLLLPSSSLFPAADLAADRRLYLPMVGFAACAGWLLARVRPAAAVAAVCVALAAVSVARTRVWMSEESLWQDAAEKAPEKLRPKLQLARVLPPGAALAVLEEARRLAPDDPSVPAQAGSVLLAAGRPAEALAEFGRALALAPRDARYVNNRGTALEALGQTDAAREDYRRALAMDPSLEPARENLRRVGH